MQLRLGSTLFQASNQLQAGDEQDTLKERGNINGSVERSPYAFGLYTLSAAYLQPGRILMFCILFVAAEKSIQVKLSGLYMRKTASFVSCHFILFCDRQKDDLRGRLSRCACVGLWGTSLGTSAGLADLVKGLGKVLDDVVNVCIKKTKEIESQQHDP